MISSLTTLLPYLEVKVTLLLTLGCVAAVEVQVMRPVLVRDTRLTVGCTTARKSIALPAATAVVSLQVTVPPKVPTAGVVQLAPANAAVAPAVDTAADWNRMFAGST